MLRNHLKLHWKWHPEFFRKVYDFGKSETKNISSGDDFQFEKVFSVDVNLLKEKEDCENIANQNNKKMQNIIEISLEYH